MLVLLLVVCGFAVEATIRRLNRPVPVKDEGELLCEQLTNRWRDAALDFPGLCLSKKQYENMGQTGRMMKASGVDLQRDPVVLIPGKWLFEIIHSS